MNRSIFIVIVDFLLLSLIAFARFDSDPAAPARQPQQASANLPSRQQDMMAVLKVSLDQERQAREQLNQQLNQTQAALKTREELLSEREARMRLTQEELQKKAEEAQRLAQERAAIESQFNQTRTSLTTIQQQMLRSSNEAQLSRQQLAAMEADLRKRQEELSGALSEAQFSKERLAAMEADLRKRQEAFEAANSEARVAKGVLEALQEDLRKQNQQALSLQENMAKLEQERTATEAEKQLLASRLQVVDAERKIAREQVEHMKGEVQAERTEKARLMDTTTKLTEGVNTLAQKSEALAKTTETLAQKSETLVKNTENLAQKSETLVKNSENLAKSSENIAQKTEALRKDIQENRPIAPNTFYAEFLTNRVISSVVASRPGLIGRVDRNTDANSVLLTDGTNVFALLHVDETPLAFTVPGTDWDRLMVTLRNNRQMVSAAEMWFWGYDPRVVLVPVDPVRAKALGVKAYPVAREPHKFQEAILIGAKEDYYGECRFSLEADRPQYLRMDRNFLKRLAGNFSPSRGDMVFGKNGQLLGVMVNHDYCALVNNFTALYSFRTGVVINDQKTGTKLAAMRLLLDQLPFKMQ